MSAVLDEVVAAGQMQRGKLHIKNRRQFDQQLRLLDERWMLEVLVRRLRATRSPQSNRFYWGAVIAPLSAHTGYTPNELHELMKMRYLPKSLALCDGNGEVKGEYVMGGSTRILNTAEFSAYVQQVIQFAAELDCVISDQDGGL